MGVISRVAGRLQRFFDGERHRDARQIALGGTGIAGGGGGFDLLAAYGYEGLSSYLQLDQGLMERFKEYEEMDDYPLISSALDIYADDSTQEDDKGRSIWVTSSDQRVAQLLNDLLHRTLCIEDERWEIARTLCKYGQDYEEPLITEEGVVGLNFLPPATVRRIEGPRGELYGFVQDFQGKTGYTPQEHQELLRQRSHNPDRQRTWNGLTPFDTSAPLELQVALEDWELVHFRLRGKYRRSVYGHSVLEAGRFIYRRLMLLEDAAMIFRLQRAPEKLAFYVNVGDMAPAEALAYVRKVRNEHRKKKFVNPSTGRVEAKMDPFSQDEDYWVPSRNGEDSTRIETVTSPAWQHMEDVSYFRDQLFAAIKIPKAYLGGDEGVVHNVLSSQDVRFARTILRVQREIKNGLTKVCRLHLAALGLHPDSVDFQLQMTVPSSIFELAQLEARNARADLAGRMKEFVSLPWLLRDVFGMSEQDITRILKERAEDTLRDAAIEGKAQQLIGPPPENPPPGGMPGAPDPSQLQAPQQGPQEPPQLTSRRIILPRSGRRPKALTERELHDTRGPAHDRKMSDQLGKLLKNDARMYETLTELRDLYRDLSHFQRPSAR